MRDKQHEYKFTEEECLAKGAHWWGKPAEQLIFGPVQSRKQYTHTCTYCGHMQLGYQPPIVWEESP